MKITFEIPDIYDRENTKLVTYARTAQAALLAIHTSGMWRNSRFSETICPAPRMYYDLVHQSNGIRTGLTSRPNTNLGDLTSDHFLSPQTVAEFILDNLKYMENFDLFLKLFECCCSTIAITSDENTALRDLKHTTPTMYKYKEMGISLYNEKGKEVDNILAPAIPVCEGFWDEYCEWEAKFVLSEDSKYGKPLPKNVSIARKQFLRPPPATLSDFLTC
jgi:hypothetical protein